MIIVKYGDSIKATCKFNYSGPSGYFTFALEIGTWFPFPPNFGTVKRWETQNIYISSGSGKTQVLSFVITPHHDLKTGIVYDMNWEIGTGSQDDDTWKILERKITDDIIKVEEEAEPVFSNLSVTYAKA